MTLYPGRVPIVVHGVPAPTDRVIYAPRRTFQRPLVEPGPQITAREPQLPGDPVPDAAWRWARLAERAGEPYAITYARGVVEPEALLCCAVCGMAVRVKDDGELYVHGGHRESCLGAPGTDGTCTACGKAVRRRRDGSAASHGVTVGRCDGLTGSRPEPQVIHSVLVRGGEHWAAAYENGSAVGFYWGRRPTSEANLRRELTALAHLL